MEIRYSLMRKESGVIGRVLPKGIRGFTDAARTSPYPSHTPNGLRSSMDADASSTGIAYILYEHSGKLQPIQLFSSALSSSQNNCSAGQLES